ncbi:unnamed protein product [Brassicogethes aeneus]|uniref:N-glycosylase/DNA lyase n=1 Tax=Brassicogethes aeneus TaxID=1431903 RepID=A0A9P0FCK5_BRAAE|nr:unnamed protein product [Brassicogethes aeneus]
MKEVWRKLLCKNIELQLVGTLNGGQSFRWKKILKDDKDEWVGVFRNKLWILQQEEDYILYKVLGGSDKSENSEQTLRDYFQLDLKLEDHYPIWSEKDPYFKEAAKQFYGIRILNQEVTENVFSFICSSNNNISRISSMVEKLAKFYGKEICEYNNEMYYAFPEVENLADDSVEKKLRDNGFGYRAKYINRTAQIIVENGGKKWLEKLRNMEYIDSKKNLMTLTGIGAKVADCICLMSLGHLQAIPVDTHIYQIAKRLYMPKLHQQKTVTDKIYNEIGDHFRELYGPLAGWAHTVLFCADLKKFQGNNEKEDTNTKPKKKNKK